MRRDRGRQGRQERQGSVMREGQGGTDEGSKLEHLPTKARQNAPRHWGTHIKYHLQMSSQGATTMLQCKWQEFAGCMVGSCGWVEYQ